MIRRCQNSFHDQRIILWPALSRAINLLAILNVSLFFLTGAVRTDGYWFPLVSLALLAFASLLILLPLGFHDHLGFYLINIALYVAASWFLGASIVYWLTHVT